MKFIYDFVNFTRFSISPMEFKLKKLQNFVSFGCNVCIIIINFCAESKFYKDTVLKYGSLFWCLRSCVRIDWNKDFDEEKKFFFYYSLLLTYYLSPKLLFVRNLIKHHSDLSTYSIFSKDVGSLLLILI